MLKSFKDAYEGEVVVVDLSQCSLLLMLFFFQVNSHLVLHSAEPTGLAAATLQLLLLKRVKGECLSPRMWTAPKQNQFDAVLSWVSASHSCASLFLLDLVPCFLDSFCISVFPTVWTWIFLYEFFYIYLILVVSFVLFFSHSGLSRVCSCHRKPIFFSSRLQLEEDIIRNRPPLAKLTNLFF